MWREGAWVVLTREDDDLARELNRRAYRVVTLPCVHIRAFDRGALAKTVTALGPDDRLVITSVRGADAILAAVEAREIRAPVTAIGRATNDRLAQSGVEAELAPQPDGASLARSLDVPGGMVLLARSDRALADLPAILRERGARVKEVVAYRTVAEALGDVATVRSRAPRAVVVFASPSAVDGFAAAVPEPPGAVVAIGPTTAARARMRFGGHVVVAARPDTMALADAVDRAALEVADDLRA
ncbi:MAG: hypothetical protein AUH85_08630 [Chloroflexi bacterium 13_1_40CM_4_68_4]|nr:MAG: hypothetical protein AUH85_08630 [Chloroflexi bacterium 13_1_40CM_4_68_4]